MAGSAAQAKNKDTIAKRVPCAGTGRKIAKGERGKQIGGTWSGSIKYECAECKGYYAKVVDPSTKTLAASKRVYVLNKHTRKIETAKPFAQCAECGGDIFTIDFLCESCRDSESDYA